MTDGVGDREDRRHGRGVGVGDLVRRGVADPVRVLEPQLIRVDAELECDSAHVRLGRERHRRNAETAHRGRRRAVRVDDVPIELEVGDRVGAGVVEAVLRQAVRREPRVRARVVQRQHLAAKDPAVLRDRIGHLHVPGSPGRRVEELLFARPAPLHGLARLLREQGTHRLGGRVYLAAETAADRAADDLQLVQRHLQVRCNDAHREVQRLRAGVDREPAVGLGHDLAHLGLDRGVLDRCRTVDALHDQVGPVECLLDVALADLTTIHLALEMRVPVAVPVDLRSTRIERLADVEEGRAFREVGGDRLDGSHGSFFIGCGDDRDRLPQVAHLVLGEQRLVARDPERRKVPVLEQGHVLPRDHVDALHRFGLARVEVRHRGSVNG